MKITKTKIVTVEETVDKEILCNKCGNSLFTLVGHAQDTDEDITDLCGIVEYVYRGGYSSNTLHDCTAYTFSVCEPCLDAFFKTFTIPVQEYDDYHHQSSATPEQQQKLNHIHSSISTQDLANYLLDNDQVIRAYAKLRIKQLEK